MNFVDEVGIDYGAAYRGVPDLDPADFLLFISCPALFCRGALLAL
jgi:hypothetical protein